jgi:hypothetical protein
VLARDSVQKPLESFKNGVELDDHLPEVGVLMGLAACSATVSGTGGPQFRSGLLIGAAVARYLESLLLTDVARALILFCAMPA